MANVTLAGDSGTSDWMNNERQLGAYKAPDPAPFDISGAYQNILGRAPDARELASEQENLGKYGSAQLESNLRERAGNSTPGSSAPRQAVPFQFDDPYTKNLESIAQNQMGEVRNNPGLNSLMAELTKQFQQLSSAPGFSPDELSLLNTQAFEPIEQGRQAAQQHSLERTAARGFLPSSGLAELDSRSVDKGYDQMRAAAGRDLGIKAIDQRRADLSRAIQLGQQLGITIPSGQRSEELNLANLLYQLPRNALNDSLAVLGRTPSSNDLFSQLLQLSQNNRYGQQVTDQQNSELASALGSLFGGIFS